MRLPVHDIPDDVWFDGQFPRYVRERSRQYWTPFAVAVRVAAIFHERGARHILDVGCGPGKFCLVAGYHQPELQVYGIERRARLVRLGAQLTRRLGVPNVRLSVGNASDVPWGPYDGFYFFNPFAENTFDERDRFDDEVSFSVLRFGRELLRVESLLERAPVGTVVVTYHGLGGPIPSSYELVGDERSGSDRIRTWLQGPQRQSRWAWLETLGSTTRVSRSDMRSALASLMCEDVP